MSYGVIYKITNTINGKIYVGQTIRDPRIRWKQHIRDSKKLNFPIHLAIQKYGEENFTLEILQECHTKNELDERENYFAISLDALTPKGYTCKAGEKRGSISKETRIKMSNSHKGEKNAFFGKKHSEASKSKNSDAHAISWTMISPEGEVIVIHNLRKFCRESKEKLDYRTLQRVVSGERSHHKGWKKYKGE